MKLTIDFGHPYFVEKIISNITLEDLDDYYVGANEIERLNLFFVLEASLHRLQNENKPDIAARCAFLMAYYVFLPLTPPASYELANYYIDKAIELHPTPEYQKWKGLIEQGN